MAPLNPDTGEGTDLDKSSVVVVVVAPRPDNNASYLVPFSGGENVKFQLRFELGREGGRLDAIAISQRRAEKRPNTRGQTIAEWDSVPTLDSGGEKV